MKWNNIHIIGIPEREESEQGIENPFEEIMTKNFSRLVKEKVTQFQELQRVSIKRNPKRTTPRHVIIKMTKFKDKDRILKAAREKQLPQGCSNKTISWFFNRNTSGQKGLA